MVRIPKWKCLWLWLFFLYLWDWASCSQNSMHVLLQYLKWSSSHLILIVNQICSRETHNTPQQERKKKKWCLKIQWKQTSLMEILKRKIHWISTQVQKKNHHSHTLVLMSLLCLKFTMLNDMEKNGRKSHPIFHSNIIFRWKDVSLQHFYAVFYSSCCQ